MAVQDDLLAGGQGIVRVAHLGDLNSPELAKWPQLPQMHHVTGRNHDSLAAGGPSRF
jgi:hypothetical protein